MGAWSVPGWGASLPAGLAPHLPVGRPGLGLATLASWGGGLPTGFPPGGLDTEDDHTIVVSDRRVRIAPGEPQPSLYEMCRRWVQNDPRAPSGVNGSEGGGEGGEPSSSGHDQAPNGLDWVRPPEPPRGPPIEDPGPVPQPDWSALLSNVPEGEAPGVPELKKHHLEHWREVRQVRLKYRAKKLERYHSRLVNLLNSRRQAGELEPPVAAPPATAQEPPSQPGPGPEAPQPVTVGDAQGEPSPTGDQEGKEQPAAGEGDGEATAGGDSDVAMQEGV